MNSTTYNDNTKKVGITLPNSLIKQVDKLRGVILREITRLPFSYMLPHFFVVSKRRSFGKTSKKKIW